VFDFALQYTSLFDTQEAMPPKKRTTPFNEDHVVAYGLKICERAPTTKQVLSVSCQFCVHFGREEKVGAKRKATTNVHYFRCPFRVDVFKSHMLSQHSVNWERYASLPKKEKARFFEESSPVVHRNTLRSHFAEVQVPAHYFVNRNIVDVIIGEMLFDPDDSTISRERALSMFEKDSDRYRIVVKNPIQFRLIIGFISGGASFRMACRFLLLTKEETGLASIGNISVRKVTSFVRFTCAINLQKISEMLASSWTFSIAMDMSTHLSTSYLDIRIRLFSGGAIQNLHLLAIPMFCSHTAEQIFVHATRALDVLCPQWRDLIVSITTDGERKMTGRVSGVATRFERVAKPGFFRIWCGLHQLDLVLQAFFKNLIDEQFYSHMTSLISYLRRQQSLIKEMKTIAKKIADTRWESMSKVTAWFRAHRVPVQDYLAEKNPSCTPPLKWWVVVHFVAKLSNEATITFRSLEGLTTLVSQQREGILNLAGTIKSWFGASELTSQEAVDALDLEKNVYSQDKKYSVELRSCENVLKDLGSFVIGAMAKIDLDEMALVVKSVATCSVNLIAALASIVAERDSLNIASHSLPPVVPHQLVKLRGLEFADVVLKQKDRLSARWSLQKIERIERDFEGLRGAYDREPLLKQVLDKCNSTTSFDKGWSYVSNRFDHLKEFCGGLASAFPGTSSVESDFSIVNWEKDDCRIYLTDISLEGIFHSKQFDKIRSIKL
jgi:hypothetical protein